MTEAEMMHSRLKKTTHLGQRVLGSASTVHPAIGGDHVGEGLVGPRAGATPGRTPRAHAGILGYHRGCAASVVTGGRRERHSGGEASGGAFKVHGLVSGTTTTRMHSHVSGYGLAVLRVLRYGTKTMVASSHSPNKEHAEMMITISGLPPARKTYSAWKRSSSPVSISCWNWAAA
ncbi:hypothetical protein CYMTET_18223 [Cymbomonas tetramitiformis]|uniref:Uncharacterized protein n=1 Tax=Cymbomonas tetramitiformis TaxID=36881 RepID=A0AAE0L651_9CHLO|nr:hypothetical protein CYMTET_18223 [Cymbomonas tetramitiformis]